MSTLSYLALGDSYTIGEGVAASQGWPSQLAAALRAQGVALSDPRIVATTGWTTDELSSALDAAEPLGEWDFVSLLIGVNNQYRGRSVVEYREEFGALLTRALRYAHGRADRLLVLSTPDWGVTPFARSEGAQAEVVAEQINSFNAVARECSETRGVAFVDITEVSRARGGEAAMLTGDGLHPSAAMYREWTTLALPVARRLLATHATRDAT